MRALALVAFVTCAPWTAYALWPRPQHASTAGAALTLSPSFTISFGPSIPHPPIDLSAAVARTRAQLFSDRLGRLVPDRGASDTSLLAHAPALAQLRLELDKGAPAIASISDEATKALNTRDEAYLLHVPTHGPATLVANSSLGIFRGLTTFGQMWYQHANTVYTLEAPVTIDDAPAYVSSWCIVGGGIC
jgi:hexosaminidase